MQLNKLIKEIELNSSYNELFRIKMYHKRF